MDRLEALEQRWRDASDHHPQNSGYGAALLKCAEELRAALACGGEAAKLTNPYTGAPRDYRDVESDPAGVLIVEPGATLLAAKPADRLPISWADFWFSQGNNQLAHDYAAFELANQWLEANIAAVRAQMGGGDDDDETPEPTAMQVEYARGYGHGVRDEEKRDATQMGGEAVVWQFQDRQGNWHNFVDDKHKAATIADGSWPVRPLYTHPSPAVVTEKYIPQIGDRVMWQSSMGTEFPGKIVAVNHRHTTYDAALDDGTTADNFAAGRFRKITAALTPQELKEKVCTRNCDCVGECKAGLE